MAFLFVMFLLCNHGYSIDCIALAQIDKILKTPLFAREQKNSNAMRATEIFPTRLGLCLQAGCNRGGYD
ncbi:MAG: hypothetical protein GX230_04500 [Lentisphaerae bacterium]|nr:hypothetical protein [Lentisphaerota bacterium]